MAAIKDAEGQSWSQPRPFHRGPERPEPINLGGQRRLLIPSDDPDFTCRSQDGGHTWSEKTPFPTLPDGRATPRPGRRCYLEPKGVPVSSGIGAALEHAVLRIDRDGLCAPDRGVPRI